MALHALAELADRDKRAIQESITLAFPQENAGIDQLQRSNAFGQLARFLLENHFVLLSGEEQVPTRMTNVHVPQIVTSALFFYEARRDSLSVRDFVTDFRAIVRGAGFGLALK